MTPVSSRVSNCSLTVGEPRSDQYVVSVGSFPGTEHTRYRTRCASRRNGAAVAADFVDADFWGRDAVLVDTPMTVEQARAVVNWVDRRTHQGSEETRWP